jgi:rifampicin phosphotransferase
MNGFENGDVKLTLPFGGIDRTMLSTAGGKAANLGELTRAGLPVSPGFCVTTAAYDFVTKDVWPRSDPG